MYEAAIADEPTDAAPAVRRHARRYGLELGNRLRSAGTALTDALAAAGFRPEQSAGLIQLTNCPFHPLAVAQTALVCGLNLAFIGGLIEALGCTGCVARLAPGPGRCCVEIDDGPVPGAVRAHR